jgi:Electron transfer DM13
MKTLICISALFIGTMACQKENVETVADMTTQPSVTMPVTTNLKDQTLLLEGTFTSAAHPTTGTVKVYEDKDKNRSLVFENFKTDAGPDLRLYMAEDKAITNFIQITDKVTTSGNYSIMIPANVDLKKQTTVAIWCKSFSVLFGSATLK